MTQQHATRRDDRPEWTLINAIHDAFRRDLDYPAAAPAAGEQRFRFRGYSQERRWAARWLLFEFPEVENLVHLGGGIVTVLYDGEPHVAEWMALLDACGFVLEPLRESSPPATPPASARTRARRSR